MRRLFLLIGVVAVGIAAVLIVGRVFSRPVEIPKVEARRGEFVISLHVTGQVDAKRAYTITAPRIRNIQITWMAKEGSMVQAGDPVIRFDSSQQQQELADQESQLKIAEKGLERSRQEFAIQEKQLALELRQAQRNFDEKKHEAPKVAEEARLQLDVAELKSNAQLDQIRSDVQKAELEVQRARDKVGNAKKELEQMTLTAPIPGMVVYLEIWKGSSMAKVQEGDSPWPGQGLINLPDLSEMTVKATVSEVDAGQVQEEQEVLISLDAVADTTFRGQVVRKGTLARKKEDGSQVNVFDVEIAILSRDERLKPGMSASAEIVVERIIDVVTVPLEAVFESQGKPIVYLQNKRSREVTPGRRNDQEIEITAGLQGGETILLVDPAFAKKGMPGDKATEPELNRGRSRTAPGLPGREGKSSG
jgi:RND family efflux transporter MFP subunit